jgi:Leucine-rich repeat (LRR) protein
MKEITNNSKNLKARQYRNAQTYLETEYPKLVQKNLKKLDLSNLNLEGELDLSNFTNLRELDCSNNKLTRLNLIGCSKL